jgi:hypothetical protein
LNGIAGVNLAVQRQTPQERRSNQNKMVKNMDKTDNYLLLLIGVLLVALIAVELIPMPIPQAPMSLPTNVHSAPSYKLPKIGSASVSSVIVIPTSTLATLTVA